MDRTDEIVKKKSNNKIKKKKINTRFYIKTLNQPTAFVFYAFCFHLGKLSMTFVISSNVADFKEVNLRHITFEGFSFVLSWTDWGKKNSYLRAPERSVAGEERPLVYCTQSKLFNNVIL